MSRYHLTEAYGELYNARLTEASFYDNLRFVDYLQSEEIEEVMESLIWEFMDYGDTLDEAVDTLEVTFSDDEVLTESLELIDEISRAGEMRMAKSRENRARQKESTEKSNTERNKTLRSFAKRDSDTAARSRRAARSATIRGALSGAKRSVKGAMETAHKQIRDKKAQLKKTGTEVVGKAQAALARVGRGGRRLVNAVKGGIEGAKSGYKAPLSTPTPRTPGRVQTQQARTAATAANGNVFAAPKATPNRLQSPRASQSYNTPSRPSPGATQAAALRQKTSEQGRTVAPTPSTPTPSTPPPAAQRRHRRHGRVHSGPQVKTPTSAVKPLVPAPSSAPTPKPAPKSRAFGSPKNREKMEKLKRHTKKAKQQIKNSVDYDLLTQYMIEDLINEGYADTESRAVSILEDMSTETLTEFASIYLDD
jgi:hypothetical protein